MPVIWNAAPMEMPIPLSVSTSPRLDATNQFAVGTSDQKNCLRQYCLRHVAGRDRVVFGNMILRLKIKIKK